MVSRELSDAKSHAARLRLNCRASLSSHASLCLNHMLVPTITPHFFLPLALPGQILASEAALLGHQPFGAEAGQGFPDGAEIDPEPE